MFESWCAIEGVTSLLATPQTVTGFVENQSSRYANSTLKRMLYGIRKVRRLCEQPNPTDNEDVAIAVRRACRKKLSRPAQALGLTRELRDKLFKAGDEDLMSLRNRAMIATAYDTLCRRSELVALRVEDIQLSARGKPTIAVRRAKNDPFGSGRSASLSTTGLAILESWLRAAGIEEGPLFRPIYHGTVINRALNPFTVSRVLKLMAINAGVEPDKIRRLSGHSMRVGAAQDLMSSGFGMLTIMRAGGWKSINVLARYVENADLQIWD